MSRARHKMRAGGGKLSSKPEWEAGGESNAAKEAEEKKKGGRVHHHAEGEHAKHRSDKRARGGHVKHHEKEEKERARGGHVNGPHEMHEVKHHSMKHHRGRARGGAIGADRAPLTTAAKVKHVTPGEVAEHGVDDMAKSKAIIKNGA